MLYILLDNLREWLIDKSLYRFVRVLDQFEFRVLAAAFLAFALVMIFGRPTINWLRRQKIGDTGNTDAALLQATANAKANTPSMGGVLIVGAILVSTLLLADISRHSTILGMVVLLWYAGIGGADDWLKLTAKRRGGGRQGLYAWEKLVFQVGGAALFSVFLYRQGMVPDAVGVAGDLRHVLNLPFQKTYVEPASSLNPALIFLSWIPFVIVGTLMISGMSNAVNITDGMDGLASGVGMAVSIGVCVLAAIAGRLDTAQFLLVPHIPGSGELAVMAGAVAGACLGFLWFNCSPAQVFMGDTGALSLGGIIGYIAVVTRQEFVVLLMCGVFLIEIGSVVLQVGYFKATKGKRIFRVAPYHHHLHLGGWPEQQVVARMWLVSIILVVLALASIKVR